MFSFAGFFLTLAFLLGQVATGWAFASAIAVAFTIQAATLWALLRRRKVAGDEPLFGKG